MRVPATSGVFGSRNRFCRVALHLSPSLCSCNHHRQTHNPSFSVLCLSRRNSRLWASLCNSNQDRTKRSRSLDPPPSATLRQRQSPCRMDWASCSNRRSHYRHHNHRTRPANTTLQPGIPGLGHHIDGLNRKLLRCSRTDQTIGSQNRMAILLGGREKSRER
jgi:hypothetical protein